MVVNLRRKVKEYWDNTPCGTRGVMYSEGTFEYYEAISQNRYRLEPIIFKFAEFNRWAGKKVLEIGCGAGSDLLEFAKQGAIITGIDLSSKSVALTRKRLEVYKLRGNAFECDAERIPFRSGVFDLVYCWGVLHHIPNPEKVVSEIYQILKPDGEIRIMLYHRYSLVSLQAYLWFGLFRLRPFKRIDEIMAKHMESAGTKVYTIEQAKRMFSMFRNLSVKPVATIYDIRYARDKYLPKFVLNLIPDRLGWFMLIKGIK